MGIVMANCKDVLTAFGTRPEAIKMTSVVKGLREFHAFEVSVCVAARHRQMLGQVLDLFDICPEYDLDLKRPDQAPTGLTATALGVVTDSVEVLVEHLEFKLRARL